MFIKKTLKSQVYKLTRHDRALNKRIACVTNAARAGGHMINDVAIG